MRDLFGCRLHPEPDAACADCAQIAEHLAVYRAGVVAGLNEAMEIVSWAIGVQAGWQKISDRIRELEHEIKGAERWETRIDPLTGELLYFPREGK